MSGPTLSEFLLARIAEDEELASSATCQCGGPVCNTETGWYRRSELTARLADFGDLSGRGSIDFVLALSPARVLAECAAKRAIVALHSPVEERAWQSGAPNDWLWCGSCGSIDDAPDPYPCGTLRALAAVYSDHPDFRAEWRA